MDLSEKSAAITGAASGIGLEAAMALGACGARLELLDVNSAKLELIRSRLIDKGLKVSARVLDVTKPKAVADVAAKIKISSGPVDILVNSAGIAHLHSAIEVSNADWRRVMDVNVNGTFWCCREFGKGMVEAGCGSIVNMGSIPGNRCAGSEIWECVIGAPSAI